MTPEQARKLLAGITPPPWEFDSSTYQEVDCPEATEFWANGRKGRQVAEQTTINRHLDETERNFNLIAAAPDMAAMIAGMRTEYAIEYQPNPDSQWHRISEWSEEYPLIDGEELKPRERIVKRYVTAPQPLGETK